VNIHGWRNELVGRVVDFFSPNDMSGLTPKNVKFGTKVASSTRMMRALGFWNSFLIVAKFARKIAKNANKISKLFSTRYPRNQKQITDG